MTDNNLFVLTAPWPRMMPVMMLVMNGVSLLIVWVGGHQIARVSHAGGRHDGLHPVHHADHYELPHDQHDVRDGAPRHRLGRAASARCPCQRKQRAGRARSPGTCREHVKGRCAVQRRLLPLRGRGRKRAGACHLYGPARRDNGLHRLHRLAANPRLINLIPRFYDVTGGQRHRGRRGRARHAPA